MNRPSTSTGQPAPENPALDAVADVARCLRFYSRLPVPALPWEGDPHALPDFARVTRMLPVAGAIVGMVGALAFLAAASLDLGDLVAATFAITLLTLITGAFHEDGLADTFDAFGGGATPERRLEIMKDSRIGTFGGAALMLGLLLRIVLLAKLSETLGAFAAAAAIVTFAGLSRSVALMPLTFLPPARLDGASAAVGRPTRAAFFIACTLAAALTMALGLPAGHPPGGIALAIALSFAAAALVTRWSRRMIGGQTGDVAGTAQQLAEIAALLGLLIIARS